MSYTWNGRAHKGAMRDHRATLRAEGDARNARTVHERTRAHRVGRCRCVTVSRGKRRKVKRSFGFDRIPARPKAAR